jgi:pyruvate dehydrogenase E2 component (dihydrolipoamide acetyltransferase)
MEAEVKPYTAVVLSPMRRIIAARMMETARTIPHFRVVADIEVDALVALRKAIQAQNPSQRLSLNDFVIKACAGALIEVPAINIQWAETEIHHYSAADISVVTAVKGGLSTPIVRRADSKTIWEISNEVKELAARAAKNTLKMDEIFGGSFSISNLGMYAVDQFDAIINPPQCAILAVGRAKRQMVVGEDDLPRIATIMRVTLSVDHRAIDGQAAATFLSALRRRLEEPADVAPVAPGQIDPDGRCSTPGNLH